MAKPLICLCLTGKTLDEDLKIIEQYKQYIDLVELRVDFLDEDERLKIRDFPTKAGFPCILTIRRVIDGGQYADGEAARTTLFARGLAFANEDYSKNFAYVDFEEDFHIPSLQDAALAYGTKIIRSYHNMKEPVKNIAERLKKMSTSKFEIPKIAFMPHSLRDVTDLYIAMKDFKNSDQIICAMGPIGLPTRILAERFNSFLTYTSPAELIDNLRDIGHVDPKTLDTLYHFHKIDDFTKLFGITGWPLKYTSSPKIHNEGFAKTNQNAVYIPFKAESADDAFDFAENLGIKGFSVTIPHKENIIKDLKLVDRKVELIGACNTVINKHGIWTGYNTDCDGFARALLEFTGLQDLKKLKISIIGAGGAAKAVAYAVKSLGGKACVFNRTLSKARDIAEKYGFDYEFLSLSGVTKMSRYNDIIVQTTSIGMGSKDKSNERNDPIWFYEFAGTEMVYDIVYEPEETPMLVRAKKAGCRIHNGFTMLKYQGEEQFKLFTEVYKND